MAEEALLVTQFLSAGLMLALAAWLLWLRFTSPINRSFALFLTLRALTTVSTRFKTLADNTSGQLFWGRVAEYFFLALVPALAYFLVVYLRPRGNGRSTVLRLAILATGLAVELAYLADHCLARCSTLEGKVALGPLALVSYGLPFASATVALILAKETLRDPGGPRAGAAFLVSVGFLLNAVLDASLSLSVVLRYGREPTFSPFQPGPWVEPVFVIYLLGFLPSFLALVAYLRLARIDSRSLAKVRNSWIAAAMALVTGLAAAWAPTGPGGESLIALFFIGLWRLLLPGLLTYALVRHQLFGVDVKVRWTIRRGTIAASFMLEAVSKPSSVRT